MLLRLALLACTLALATGQAPSLDTLRKTAEQMPNSAAAQSNYGTGLKSAGRLEEAMERFDMALELDPSYARAYNNMGNVYQAMGDWPKAVNAHGQAIALMPGLASAYSNLGNALREMGEPKLAVTALGSAVELNPSYAAAYTNLGSATMALGDATTAARWHGLAAALHGFRDPSSLNNLGAALEADGKLGEAADAFDMGLKLQPASAVLQLNRGNVHRKLGELSEAVAAYSRSIQLEPDGADAHIAHNNVAAALLAEGELERALEAYETALTLAPTSELARVNRDKLPISHAYVSAANTETRMLADRAARVILATAGSRRARGAGHGGAAHATQLYRVCRFLRRLESKQLEGPLAGMLWSTRGGDMPAAISAGATDDGAQYTLSAFAWGGVWLPSLAATFTHPETRAALLGAGATAVVLGASIGFEAYYTSLALGVPTVGVELLCSLTTIADDVRAAHRVHERHMRFECADALTINLPRSAALVYVDDTAWDEPTIRQLAAKLARTLRKGSVVVHNALAGYADSTAYRLLQSYAVDTSWNAEHAVHAHVVV